MKASEDLIGSDAAHRAAQIGSAIGDGFQIVLFLLVGFASWRVAWSETGGWSAAVGVASLYLLFRAVKILYWLLHDEPSSCPVCGHERIDPTGSP